MSRKTVSANGVVWLPTQTVVLTFDGQALPSKVFAFYSSLPVDQYVYPTIQCFNCCRFGHTRLQCRSKPRCFKCGGEHDGTSCSSESFSCINCSGTHKATESICPENLRQKNIKQFMSSHSVSYQEADKKFAKINKPSFAEVVATVPPPQTPEVTSYKKTVFIKNQKPPVLSKGYNKSEHNALVNSYNIPAPANGVANHKETEKPEIEIETITELLKSLIHIITNSQLPEHVAKSLINNISLSLFDCFKHGFCPSVEH